MTGGKIKLLNAVRDLEEWADCGNTAVGFYLRTFEALLATIKYAKN